MLQTEKVWCVHCGHSGCKKCWGLQVLATNSCVVSVQLKPTVSQRAGRLITAVRGVWRESVGLYVIVMGYGGFSYPIDWWLQLLQSSLFLGGLDLLFSLLLSTSLGNFWSNLNYSVPAKLYHFSLFFNVPLFPPSPCFLILTVSLFPVLYISPQSVFHYFSFSRHLFRPFHHCPSLCPLLCTCLPFSFPHLPCLTLSISIYFSLLYISPFSLSFLFTPLSHNFLLCLFHPVLLHVHNYLSLFHPLPLFSLYCFHMPLQCLQSYWLESPPPPNTQTPLQMQYLYLVFDFTSSPSPS